MGFSYRKSFKAGPIRATASKSGVGCSAGAKGFRVAERADEHVRTTISAPGAGLHHTATSTGHERQRNMAATATTSDVAMPVGPAAGRERRRWRPGAWYFVIVLLSVGLFSAIPFAHAAARLGRKGLRLRAGTYAAVAAALVVLSSITPKDAQGHAVGTAGHVLSAIFAILAVALMATACFQLVPLRREVYGLGTGPARPAHPAAADPVVAAHLAARARRNEARTLAQSDPVLAHDLRIGRPDLSRQYDDGGLVDLNNAPAHTIADACSIELTSAEQIVAARQELGSFSSLDEVVVFARIEEGAAARIRDYAILLPG
ncbi:DUF4236 domain-containing protein [Kitasatospora sp. NPDC059577]|uniref:DUF4236 domain-containing protein n=1 Tax=unclassified Kitasatospora TaxID=2633591 RepID=UPI0036872156